MKIEEIKKLTDAELGEAVVWKCPNGAFIEIAELQYRTPKRPFTSTAVLCTDLNAIAEIEKIVIEKVGVINYDTWLKVCVTQWTVIATARQRAEACLLALQEE